MSETVDISAFLAYSSYRNVDALLPSGLLNNWTCGRASRKFSRLSPFSNGECRAAGRRRYGVQNRGVSCAAFLADLAETTAYVVEGQVLAAMAKIDELTETPGAGGSVSSSGGHLGGPSGHGAKVKRGQLTAVQQGRYGTGPAPYGYRRGKEGERPLEVDDREAEVVRTIFREYLRTRSTGKVVQHLHAKSIKTRKSNRWSRQAIAIILSNRTYRGRVSYGEVETQGLHEPIIEPALFYKANSIKERKKRGSRKNGKATPA